MPTLDDVAKAAGVSRDAVSRALSGKTKAVWPKTREKVERIRRIAQDMGYRPNAAARAMATNKFSCVTMILGNKGPTSTVSDTLLDGLLDSMGEHNYRLNIAKLSDDTLNNADKLPAALSELSADGLLLNYNYHMPARMQALVEQYQIPAVWINRRAEHDCVHPDDILAGEMATRHLISLGHTRIMYVDVVRGDHYSHLDREAGYVKAMAHAGLDTQVMLPEGQDRVLHAAAQLRDVFRQPDRPTAIVTYSFMDMIAHVAAEEGLRVPHDVSLVSFSQRPLRVSHLSATTVLIADSQVGHEALNLLDEKMAAPDQRLPSRTVEPGFHPGQTSAAPSRG